MDVDHLDVLYQRMSNNARSRGFFTVGKCYLTNLAKRTLRSSSNELCRNSTCCNTHVSVWQDLQAHICSFPTI